MVKKTRVIILLVCVALFLIIAPYIVLYSMGYRVDFENMKIVATGGIYVRTFPQASQVVIDSGIPNKPSMFTGAVFVQNLLPEQHSVLIKKTGYFDYQKNLEVAENKVTKLENVLLIKQNLAFNLLANKIDYFSVSADNKNILTEGPATKSLGFQYFSLSNPSQKKVFSLATASAKVLDIKWDGSSSKALIKISAQSGQVSYYIFDSSKNIQQTTPLLYLDKNSQLVSFNPQDSTQIFYVENKTLYSLKSNKVSTIIKNIITYKISGSNIIWLSSDGFLSGSDIAGKLSEKLTAKIIAISANKNYEIITIAGQTFLKENNALFLYNPSAKTLEDFKAPIDNYSVLVSPDGKNMVYYNSKDIHLYSFLKNPLQNNVKIFSANSPEIISNCFWLNNDYIIFSAQGGPASGWQNKIIISEIDYRGNINAVTLPQNYQQFFFNPQDAKVYALNANALYSSEKITP